MKVLVSKSCNGKIMFVFAALDPDFTIEVWDHCHSIAVVELAVKAAVILDGFIHEANHDITAAAAYTAESFAGHCIKEIVTAGWGWKLS